MRIPLAETSALGIGVLPLCLVAEGNGSRIMYCTFAHTLHVLVITTWSGYAKVPYLFYSMPTGLLAVCPPGTDGQYLSTVVGLNNSKNAPASTTTNRTLDNARLNPLEILAATPPPSGKNLGFY